MKDDRPEDELRHACLTPPLPSWSPTRWAVNLKTAGSMMTAANGQCLSQSSKSNIRRTGEEKTPSSNVAMIHEAGAMAVAKSHSRSPHRINTEGADGLIHNSLVLNASVSTEISGAPDPFNNPTFLAALRTSKTATLLNLPLIWDTIKAPAQFIRNNDEGDGAYGALGLDCHARRGQRSDRADEDDEPHARLAMVQRRDSAAQACPRGGLGCELG